MHLNGELTDSYNMALFLPIPSNTDEMTRLSDTVRCDEGTWLQLPIRYEDNTFVARGDAIRCNETKSGMRADTIR